MTPLHPTGGVIPRYADGTPLVFFVDVGERVRVLCQGHHAQVCPTAHAVAVTDLEQKQSRLFFDAPIRCEECTGMVAGR